MPAAFTYDDYRQILRAGLAAGYRFSSFAEREGGENICLMRHDCDNDLVAAAAMADIEKEEGVQATYFLMLRSAMYNLLAPDNLKLARHIRDHGHWIGLHFDASELGGRSDRELSEEVDLHRAILSRELGGTVDVISFHQPDSRILNGMISLNCINTYSKSDMAGIYYTSDSNLAFRGGHPCELFSRGEHRRIQVLTHPEWWTASPMPLEEKWAGMIRNNLDLMQDSLLKREKTYIRRHRIRIDSGSGNDAGQA